MQDKIIFLKSTSNGEKQSQKKSLKAGGERNRLHTSKERLRLIMQLQI